MKLFSRQQVQPDPEYAALCRDALIALEDNAAFIAYDVVIESAFKECFDAVEDEYDVGTFAESCIKEVKLSSPLGQLQEQYVLLNERVPNDRRLAPIGAHLTDLLRYSVIEVETSVVMLVANTVMKRGKAQQDVYFSSRNASENADLKKESSARALGKELDRIRKRHPDLADQLGRF